MQNEIVKRRAIAAVARLKHIDKWFNSLPENQVLDKFLGIATA